MTTAVEAEGSARAGIPFPARRHRAVALLLLAHLAYAGVFVWKSSFLVEGERHFVLFEDMMISMSYARTLAGGDGLVLFPGADRVEGFSDPLWVGVMTLAHLLPLSPAKISLSMQLLAVVLLTATLWLVYGIALEISGGVRAPALGAVLLTATYWPLENWAVQGTDVAPAMFLVALAVRLSLGRRARRVRPTTVYALLGMATLLRLDLLPAAGCLAVWRVLTRRSGEDDGGGARRELLLGGSILAAFVALQTLARLAYYGEWLPNSYFLKLTGFPLLPRLATGLYWIANLVVYLGVVPVALVLVWGVCSRDGAKKLLAALFLTQVAYSVWVGGDAWEGFGADRFVAIAMPFLFTLLALGLWRLVSRIAESAPDGRDRLVRPAIFVPLLLGLALQANLFAGDLGDLRWLAWKGMSGGSWPRQVERAAVIRSLTRPEARVAVLAAGTIGYFLDRPLVDLLGKNDAHVARLPMHRLDYPVWRRFYPGHLKWDYGYSIGELRPDVVASIGPAPEEAAPYLARDYVTLCSGGWVFWARRDSERVRWDRITERAGAPEPAVASQPWRYGAPATPFHVWPCDVMPAGPGAL